MNDPRMDCTAYAPGYPKIPNKPHERQEIDQEALQDFMPVDTQALATTLTSRGLFNELKAQPNSDAAWSVAFTVPALFARVKNLEAQVLAGWEMAAHWEREIEAMKQQANVRFVSDRRANTDYRMRIVETGSMEDRNCFGLPTVVTIQVHVPRTSGWSHEEEATYEGKYALLHNHHGSRAMTMAATSEDAIVAISRHLPGPYTEQEDPALIAQDAIKAIKGAKLLLTERAQFEKDAGYIESLIVKVQHKLDLVQKKKCPSGNLNEAQTLLHSLLDRFIELRGEDPATIDQEV